MVRRALLSAVVICGLLLGSASAQTLPIREVVVEPDQFVGKTVSVVGQFRGRNLFGDVADVPDREQDGFVLRSGDAAIWIFGVRPRGKDFSLDPTRPADAGLWLKVTGTVERARGSIWIKGHQVERASPRDDSAVAIAVAFPPAPIDVVFSAPVAGDVDVRLTARIRIQLSDDVDAKTVQDHVRLSYSTPDSIERGEAPPPAIPFSVNYVAETRAIEIVPASPLERFREVTVELLDGIKSTAGGVLKPWRLTFTTGGS